MKKELLFVLHHFATSGAQCSFIKISSTKMHPESLSQGESNVASSTSFCNIWGKFLHRLETMPPFFAEWTFHGIPYTKNQSQHSHLPPSRLPSPDKRPLPPAALWQKENKEQLQRKGRGEEGGEEGQVTCSVDHAKGLGAPLSKFAKETWLRLRGPKAFFSFRQFNFLQQEGS